MTGKTVKLVVRDLTKSFRIRGAHGSDDRIQYVLGGVSFEVGQGELVAIIGESGCGKTTLLKIIQGLIRYDSGSILVDNISVSRPGRDRGFVFQHASLLPWRSAKHNIELGLEIQGIPARERASRAQSLLELVGLADAADQYPDQLSGGMQQRIGLARALAIDPAILLMDEPFSALDAQTREVLQDELLRIHAQTEKTTLFVTHDLDEAIYLSDRVVVLAAKPGRVKQIVDIPFTSPRPSLPEMRGNPLFQDIRSTISSLIRVSTTEHVDRSKSGATKHIGVMSRED
jgi:NitT/TauT family transport system ATP-binding protein